MNEENTIRYEIKAVFKNGTYLSVENVYVSDANGEEAWLRDNFSNIESVVCRPVTKRRQFI